MKKTVLSRITGYFFCVALSILLFGGCKNSSDKLLLGTLRIDDNKETVQKKISKDPDFINTPSPTGIVGYNKVGAKCYPTLLWQSEKGGLAGATLSCETYTRAGERLPKELIRDCKTLMAHFEKTLGAPVFRIDNLDEYRLMHSTKEIEICKWKSHGKVASLTADQEDNDALHLSMSITKMELDTKKDPVSPMLP